MNFRYFKEYTLYHPTTRLLTVLELLQARERISGAELATRLKVETRTVRRYIIMLQELGIPVEAERGRYGAYRLRPGFKLPPLMFTEDEALALTLGLLNVRRVGLVVPAQAVEGAITKVERVLPIAVRERIQLLQQVLVLEEPRSPVTAEGKLLVQLSEAVAQARSVTIGYRADKGEETWRELDPYGLVHLTGRWYTVGYCHLRQAVRVFRLDRITTAKLAEASFNRPENFDCLDYVKQSFAGMLTTWQAEILLDLSLEEAESRIPQFYGRLEPRPKGVLFRTTADDLGLLARYLVGLGCDFVVFQPLQLREALKQFASRIVSMAEQVDWDNQATF